ncbi:hypothetical protein PINS_up002613 [Pythium insidiosum]|nr:hypothetical protein PINS_up002613 [Pythium insidiosum]
MLRERKSSRETAVLALAMNMQMSTPAHEPIQEAATTIEARSDPPKSTDIGYTSNQKLLNPPRPPKMNTVAVDNGMEETSAKSPRSPSSVTPVSLTDTPRGEVVPFLAAGLGTGGAPQAISRRFSLRTMDLTPPKPQPLPQRLKEWTKNSFRGRAMGVVFPKIAIDPRQRQSKLEPYTLRHDTVQRQIWDAFIILLILLDIVITPFSLGFHVDFRGLDVFNAFVTVSFTMDFAINMFSSYVTERGTIASGPRNTIPNYLLSIGAIADFLSWFPVEYFVKERSSEFLGIAKIIRLSKIQRFAFGRHSARKAGLFRLTKLFGTVFITSHCLACYWNWVAEEWRSNETGYLQQPLFDRYAHCWSLVIGSINASPPPMYTSTEKISVAVFMLIGNLIQASVFGSVAVLISSFDEEEVAYSQKLISTYERCKFLGIPEPLARRILGYYEHLYRETRSVNPDADAFINELSPALICEVKFQLYLDMIKQIPFFASSRISPAVIEMLILHLRTVIYMQDDVLIRKGEFGDWMGFIGSKGSVGVLSTSSEINKVMYVLRKGDYFGEMALVQSVRRTITVVALSWVQIHVLSRGDLEIVKQQYPDQAAILEEEIYKYMKSKVKYKHAS